MANWVREAVAITDALTQNGAGRYLCPLCLEWFDDLQDLSLEHAPPASVGGSHIAVTCRGCNSTAGSSIDAALRWTETVRQFGSQAMTKPMPATFSFAGIEQRVAAQFGPDGLSIMGVGKQNHPDVAPAMITALDEMVVRGSTEGTMTLSFRSPDFRAASIGWLRAAYLAAFAMLGYLYVLRGELDDVRLQIRDPTARILERYCVMTRGGPSARRIAIVREPAELASVTVLSNDCAVFLPNPEMPGTYRRLAELNPWPPKTHELFGLIGPWPAKPTYALDQAALA
jgi:HNH endonuclease